MMAIVSPACPRAIQIQNTSPRGTLNLAFRSI